MKKNNIVVLALLCLMPLTSMATEKNESVSKCIEALDFRYTPWPGGRGRRVIIRQKVVEAFSRNIDSCIESAVTNTSEDVRINAMHAISVLGHKKFIPLLVDRIVYDDSESVRASALDNLFRFFEDTSPREFLKTKTIDRLAKVSMDRIRKASEDKHYMRNKYLKVLEYLKYADAEKMLLSLWEQSGGFEAAHILDTVYAIDPKKADELLLQDGTRERMKHNKIDTLWFLALSRSAQQNEESLEVVKEILSSYERSEREYVFVGDSEFHGALLTGNEELRQWVWTVIEKGNKSNRRSAIRAMKGFAKDIIKTQKQKTALLKAIKNDERLYRHFTQSKSEDFDKGTIGHWLASQNSPLREGDEEGGGHQNSSQQ